MLYINSSRDRHQTVSLPRPRYLLADSVLLIGTGFERPPLLPRRRSFRRGASALSRERALFLLNLLLSSLSRCPPYPCWRSTSRLSFFRFFSSAFSSNPHECLLQGRIFRLAHPFDQSALRFFFRKQNCDDLSAAVRMYMIISAANWIGSIKPDITCIIKYTHWCDLESW